MLSTPSQLVKKLQEVAEEKQQGNNVFRLLISSPLFLLTPTFSCLHFEKNLNSTWSFLKPTSTQFHKLSSLINMIKKWRRKKVVSLKAEDV